MQDLNASELSRKEEQKNHGSLQKENLPGAKD